MSHGLHGEIGAVLLGDNSGTVTKFVRRYSSSEVISLTNLVTVPELSPSVCVVRGSFLSQ